MQLYQELLMNHYRYPRNVGTIENPDFSTGDYNPSCGDSIAIQGIIKDNIIRELAFTGKGCIISQATASLLTQASINKPINEVLLFSKEDILSLIHIPLGPLRIKCGLLALQALQKGIILYQEKQKALR